MALNINGRMKVKTLRADFLEEFGLTLRVYDGRSFADDDATLASIRKGDSKGGEFSPKRNTKVGNLEDKIMDMFEIKTQVAGSDDSYLCDNDLTLAAAQDEDGKKMGRKERKASSKEIEAIVEESASVSQLEDGQLDFITLVLNVELYYDEASDVIAQDQGYDDYESMDDEEKEEIYSEIMYAVIDEYVRDRVVDLFKVRVAEEDKIDSIYIRFGDKFVNLDSFGDVDGREYEKLKENGKEIAVYFILSEPIEFDGPYDSYFIKLSEGIDSFKLIASYDNKTIMQGYCDGDYDSGYLSNDAAEYYILQPGGDDYYTKYVANKETVLNNLIDI